MNAKMGQMQQAWQLCVKIILLSNKHATLNAARTSTIFMACRTTVLEHPSHSTLVQLARDGVKRTLF
jgi:hypothetical protein